VAPSEQPQQPQQPQHAAVAAGLAGSVADTPAQVALVQHDVDDSYELEELDADWKVTWWGGVAIGEPTIIVQNSRIEGGNSQ
jgi:hypothetical protein